MPAKVEVPTCCRRDEGGHDERQRGVIQYRGEQLDPLVVDGWRYRSRVEVHSSLPEQRIGNAPEVAEHRPDSPLFDEPSTAARLPQAPCPSHERRQVHQTAHGPAHRTCAVLACFVALGIAGPSSGSGRAGVVATTSFGRLKRDWPPLTRGRTASATLTPAARSTAPSGWSRRSRSVVQASQPCRRSRHVACA